MQDNSVDLNKINDDLLSHRSDLNYLYRYTQTLALSTSYQNYSLRNMFLEQKVRGILSSTQRAIKVYYYVYLLDQVSYPLLDALRDDDSFELRVIADTIEQIPFLSQRGYNCELKHSAWEAYPEHSRSDQPSFNADICFSEMPYGILPNLKEAIRPWMIAGNWLPDYSEVFPDYEINNSLFCMVHYAYFLADEWLWLMSNPDINPHYGLPYPNFCWMYFLESEEHLKFARRTNEIGNTSNYVVSGYPKYDYYGNPEMTHKTFAWKHAKGEVMRVIYAPHFQRTGDVLERTLISLLDMADTGSYEIIFKPHPVYNAIVEEYAERFSNHPYCQTVRHSDSSQYIFSTCDIAIISSVSMHADGLFSCKPYITELEESNFNHIGREVHAAGYKLQPDTDLKEMIKDILIDGNDGKKDDRDYVRKKLSPNTGSAVQTIIKEIKTRLGVL